MGTLVSSQRSAERLGLPPIPDYDGNGWNPLRHFRPGVIDCWYPAWAIRGNTWLDMGPHGQHLTAVGNPVPTFGPRAGLNGRRAALFTSSDYYSGAEKASAPNGGDKITIVVWYPTNTNQQWLFGKGISDGNEEWIHAGLNGLYYDSGDQAWVQHGGSTNHDANAGYVTCGKNNGNTHDVQMWSHSGFSSGWASANRSGSISSSAGNITIGRARNTAGSMTGYIAEALCVRGTAQDATANEIMMKFALYYGIRR